VHFQESDIIWVPSRAFARGLQGVVNSGSASYNIADSAGLAGFVERTGELWDDFGRAIDLSGRYIGEAIGRHTEQALWQALEALALMLVAAVGLLAISTALGAAVGALAGGVGAAPGAAAGFEVGMALLEWLGLGLLVTWVGSALLRVGGAFGDFLGTVWTARGDQTLLNTGARQFAEAVGTLMGVLVEAVVFLAAARGIGARPWPRCGALALARPSAKRGFESGYRSACRPPMRAAAPFRRRGACGTAGAAPSEARAKPARAKPARSARAKPVKLVGIMRMEQPLMMATSSQTG
jgi:hypothetical protein